MRVRRKPMRSCSSVWRADCHATCPRPWNRCCARKPEDPNEAIMEQLMNAEPPDAAKIRPEIDRVATARAELEKANANMLLGMRLVLSKEQWEILRASAPGRGRGGPVPRKVR